MASARCLVSYERPAPGITRSVVLCDPLGDLGSACCHFVENFVLMFVRDAGLEFSLLAVSLSDFGFQ